MSRFMQEIDIIIRFRNPETNKMKIVDCVELEKYPYPCRAFKNIRFNGKNSDKFNNDSITPTEIGHRIRKLLKIRLRD